MAFSDTRIVAIEVQSNIAALKTAVDALKTEIDAINTVAAAWTLDGANADLPTEAAVKAQLAAYDSLTVAVTKPSNSMNDSLAVIRAAA